MKADAEHPPDLERVREHEQLGFGVGAGADRRRSEPCIANLTDVGMKMAVAPVALRPGPTLYVEVPCRANHHAIGLAHGGKRHGGAGFAPAECGIHIQLRRFESLGNNAPAIQTFVTGRGGD